MASSVRQMALLRQFRLLGAPNVEPPYCINKLGCHRRLFRGQQKGSFTALCGPRMATLRASIRQTRCRRAPCPSMIPAQSWAASLSATCIMASCARPAGQSRKSRRPDQHIPLHPALMMKVGSPAGGFAQSGNLHGFVRQTDGTYTEFKPMRSVGTIPAAIDGKGTVAGSYSTANTLVSHGFLRTR